MMNNFSQKENTIPLSLAGRTGCLLFFYPFLYALLARRRDLEQYTAVDFSALIYILFSVISFYVTVREIKKNNDNHVISLLKETNIRFFVYYSVWGMITTLWSVNIPLSGYRSFECVSMLFLIVAVIERLVREHGVDIMIRWVLKWLIAGSIFASLFKRVKMGYYSDITMISQMTATVFMYLAFFSPCSRFQKALITFFSIFSLSTTSYIGFAIGSSCLWFGNSKKRIFALLFTFSLLIIFLSYNPYKVLKGTVFSQRKEIGIEDTSGRNKVWEVLWEWGNKKPICGWGFFAGEPYILYQTFKGAINAHSSFLSSFVGTGYIGLLLLSIYIFSYIPILLKTNMLLDYRSSLIGCYAVALCHCIANPGIGSRVYGSWYSVTLLFVMMSVISFYNTKTTDKKVYECASHG